MDKTAETQVGYGFTVNNLEDIITIYAKKEIIMPGFKIYSDEKKWYFSLFPANSNIQALGKSIEYSSQEQCMQALLRFRKFIKSNHVNSLLSKFVSIKQEGNCGSYFITDEDGKIIFKSERVHRNSSVQTSINNTISSIYKNIDENIDVCSESYQRGRFYEESNSDNNFMCEHI